MIDQRSTIDSIVRAAQDELDIFEPSVVVATDAKNVYDVHIRLDSEKKTSPPHLIALSYDRDAGYFIDIDRVTWEFQNDEALFRSEAIKLFEAICNNKVKILKKRFLNIITVGYEAHIE